MLQLKRHYSILTAQAVITLNLFCDWNKAVPQMCGTGGAAAEGRLCQPGWSLYGHRSTGHCSIDLRLSAPSYKSQACKGEPLLVLFRQWDHPFSIPQLTEWCLQKLKILVVFNWHICSGHERQCIFHLHHMHVVGKKKKKNLNKSHFLTKQHIVF